MKSNKIAFVYNGQGSQHKTMGLDFYKNYDQFKRIIDHFQLMGRSYFECLNEESLTSTEIMQPIIFTFNYALTELLLSVGLKPHAVCGQSLGEYNALVTAGVLPFEEALELTIKRGQIMKKAASKPTLMMAAFGDSEAILKATLPKDIYISNINSDQQIVLGGTKEAFDLLKQEKMGAIKRLIPLKTEAAFHTPFMDEARHAFENILEKITLNDPQINIYQNIHGKKSCSITKSSLANHINHPVEFKKMIESLIQDGVDTIIEIGPKSLLKKMIQAIDDTLNVIPIYDVESFKDFNHQQKGMQDV